ncbi:MAG: molybdopterin-dependent oxidoreductase [Phycisphaera sp.]|nr:molybdopterin-dependent oxidoreductase [Phycisphaera sp.]
MPTITIDGKPCEFEGKKMILQVAQENGVAIPHYCYHPGLSIVASCRICLAEVEAPNPRNNNKPELIPKLMPTCQTPAADGMVVHTNSPKSVANQKAVMEYLLINHPVDCPVCDQAGECYLQDYSYQYGRGESRFQEDKIKQPKKDVGPNVLLYSDRCIMCSRCVRFTREVTGTNELAVFGRGSKEQIDVFPGVALDNELSGNVVDICPVGALLDKDFLFTQRVWFLKQTPSIDGLTASGDNIEIHHNEGKVYRVKPRYNAEVNKWWTSDEIRYGWKFFHSEDRLRSPMKQQYSSPVECDWNAAYDDARQGLRKAVKEKGDGSLLLVVSPMLSCEEAYLLGKVARAIDDKATLAVGPIPRNGEDKTFPGGYKVYAEKCPNSRGVRRALELVAGEGVLAYEDAIKKLTDKASPIGAMILTGNYPSQWATKELVGALKGKFTLLIDTLPSDASPKADIVLPGATWMEKSGCFENATGVIQAFAQAVPVIELAKSEGQIALDLLAALGVQPRSIFDASKVRAEMGQMFAGVTLPATKRQAQETDMQYVEL